MVLLLDTAEEFMSGPLVGIGAHIAHLLNPFQRRIPRLGLCVISSQKLLQERLEESSEESIARNLVCFLVRKAGQNIGWDVVSRRKRPDIFFWSQIHVKDHNPLQV